MLLSAAFARAQCQWNIRCAERWREDLWNAARLRSLFVELNMDHLRQCMRVSDLRIDVTGLSIVVADSVIQAVKLGSVP